MNAGVVVDNELLNDKRVLREIKIIRESGHDVFVLCLGFSGKQYTEPEGLTVKRITIQPGIKNTLFFMFNSFPLYEWLWASWIKKFIAEYDIEILHVHDLYMSKAAFMGKKAVKRNTPLILDLHENFPYAVSAYNWTKGIIRNFVSNPGKWMKKEREYLEYADRIVVLSEEFRDHLVSKYPLLKKEYFCCLPNVPDVAEMESFPEEGVQIPFEKKGAILFYFGVVAERRGIFDALSVFESVINEGTPVDFLIIGPVDKKDRARFFDIIYSPGLKERIIYIPWIDLSDLPAYLKISDICVAPFLKNPHHDSGVANKIYDYMLGKKPLIVSDCLPQKRLVEKHECGIVYTSLTGFHDAIIKLIREPGTRIRMGENGYNAIREEYNMEKAGVSLSLMYGTFTK
jgi:glycosyltransferase involved in cell wall biosynthesis